VKDSLRKSCGTQLTVYFVEGRTQEQWKELVVRLTDILSEILKVPKEDVMIFMVEMKKNEFAVGGKFFSER
jgi:4-oxalocrotonate tautomerase